MKASTRIAARLALAALLLSAPAGAGATPRLSHPGGRDGQRSASGHLTMIVGGEVSLRALVVGEGGGGLAGVSVEFDLITPAAVPLGSARTDENGLAILGFTAEHGPGGNAITARIDGATAGEGQIVYAISVREPSWAIFMLFGLAGGLGFFLLGMSMMSSALQRGAGSRLQSVLRALTRNRFIGVAVGAVVTVFVQSSSATTVMLVSFVRAGLLSFGQTLGVILGADIGTTVTTQLIAFKLTDYSLLMISVGFGLRLLARRGRWRNAGEALLGFGILFYGMYVMSLAMEPLRSYQPFLDALSNLESPILGIVVGTLFTALIQSSAAFIGLVIVLAQQGLLTLGIAIPLMFGANIGTCITAALAGLGGGREAGRVALAHTGFKVLGVLLFVGWIPQFAEIVRRISPGAGEAGLDPETLARVIPRQIANAHTLFNVGLALVFLPLTGLAARGLVRLLPDKPVPDPEPKYRARFLDKGMLTTPVLALNLAKVEILRLGEKVLKMTQMLQEPFLMRDLDSLDKLHEFEDEVDALDRQITQYLIGIAKQKINDEQTEEVFLMMNVTKQYEHIADIIDKELRPLARKMVAGGIAFSASGRIEVEAFHMKVVKQVARGLEAFRDGSLDKARRMTEKQQKYDALEDRYRQTHFERIRSAVAESLASSEVHLDLMDGLHKISSYSANIARAMLAHEPGARTGEPDGD